MARTGILIMLAAIALACALLPYAAEAATFNCTVRAGLCNSNETLLIRLNSAGDGYNNSHAQLANFSGSPYPYRVCCWTDAFRTLTNTCSATSTAVLKLYNTTDSHVQAGTQSGYAYNACLNVTFGNITCEYPNNACSAGYSPVLSMASSEAADSNLTNAHLGDYAYYYRKACCQVGGQNPPVVAHANITPSAGTTRTDLECLNGPVSDPDGDSVTLHYNWIRNGTSITLLNLPMDYDGASTTHDISGRALHGALAGGYDFVPTGGKVGGGFSMSSDANITVADPFHPTEYTISAWVRLDHVGPQTIVVRTDASGPGSAWSHMLRVSSSNRFEHYTYDGGAKTVTGTTTPSTASWYHVVGVAKNGNVSRLYVNGQEEGTAASITNLWASGTRYMIGPQSDSGGTYKALNGTIDEVIIFNRSLTAAEVLTMYNSHNRFLNSTELRRGDEWNCSITPVDSTGLNGSTKYSNKTAITGSAPLAPVLSYPLNNNQSVFERFINFTWSASDERDGDQVNYTLYLVRNASCAVGATQSNIQTVNYTFGEVCVDSLYNWTVAACDIDGCSGNATSFNFTVPSVVGIELVVNKTQFGTLNPGQSRATDANNLEPFIINNTGNVRVNITLVGNNSPFSSAALPTANYTFKAAVNLTNAYNTSAGASQSTYTTIDTTYKHLLKRLNYTAGSGANSTAAIHINITAPINEPPGNKQGNISVQAVMVS